MILKSLRSFFSELLEHFAQTLDALAIDIKTVLQQIAQRAVGVAVVNQLVSELSEDVMRVEIEARLAAIPLRLRIAIPLSLLLAAKASEDHEERLRRSSWGVEVRARQIDSRRPHH